MKKSKREPITGKSWLAAIFIASIIGLIIIGYVSIWESDHLIRWKFGMTFLQTIVIIYIYAYFDSELKKRKKVDKLDPKHKSFQERLEEKAKEKGVKL